LRASSGTKISLENLLESLTGSSSIPPSGFSDEPVILVDSDGEGLPTASACTLSLTFLQNYPTGSSCFKEKNGSCNAGAQRRFWTPLVWNSNVFVFLIKLILLSFAILGDCL